MFLMFESIKTPNAAPKNIISVLALSVTLRNSSARVTPHMTHMTGACMSSQRERFPLCPKQSDGPGLLGIEQLRPEIFFNRTPKARQAGWHAPNGRRRPYLCDCGAICGSARDAAMRPAPVVRQAAMDALNGRHASLEPQQQPLPHKFH